MQKLYTIRFREVAQLPKIETMARFFPCLYVAKAKTYDGHQSYRREREKIIAFGWITARSRHHQLAISKVHTQKQEREKKNQKRTSFGQNGDKSEILGWFPFRLVW